jgi:hypothetical protein
MTIHTAQAGGPTQVDAWVRPVTGWPSGSSDEDPSGTDSAVQARVHDALALELATLAIGDLVRVATAFGDGTVATDIFRTGRLPLPPPSMLGSAVGLGGWTRSPESLPPIGGDLVTDLVVVDRYGIPVPWARVLPDNTTLNIWSRLVDRLARSSLPVAVVVDVLRVATPGTRDDAVNWASEVMARRREERRRQRRAAGPDDSAATPDRGLAGDFVISLGIVGDGDALASAWRTETVTSLRPASDVPSAISWQRLSAISAPQAAQLLPLPVLSTHSGLPLRRFRPRTGDVTRPISEEHSVVVARTDSGAALGFEADAINRNVLIVGDIGTGKSTTTMSILTKLWDFHGVPWVVIDPLKFEYARMTVATSPGRRQVRVPVRHLRLGQTPINPLVVPDGVDPLAFASAMSQAFSSTSALGEAFPLADQISRAAFNELFATRAQGSAAHPTFADLEAALMKASHQDGVSGENVNNIRISLLGRLRAITSGIAGDVFAGGPRAGIDWQAMSAFPTVVTFPRGIGQQERAVIYALLVASHWSWRLANPTQGRHLIVLEEVHQAYGRSNLVASSVLDSLLATMRASGQGYLAVTQTPHQLDEQTQRLFQNLIVHRVRHSEGLEALRSLGAARDDVHDLDDGEVIALLHETRGIRGRVTDVARNSGQDNPMAEVDSHRADEFTTPGPVVRGWCSACPKPCRGRSWLGLAPNAAEAARVSLCASSDLRHAAQAALGAVLSEANVENVAGLYCATARGLIVAMGVRGATDAQARMAAAEVRSLIDARPRPAQEYGGMQ